MTEEKSLESQAESKIMHNAAYQVKPYNSHFFGRQYMHSLKASTKSGPLSTQ